MTTSDVFQMTITRESKSPSRASFNYGLVLAKNAPLQSWGADRIKAYEVSDAGKKAVRDAFGADSEEYAWALSMANQDVKPPLFYIGLRQAAVAQVKVIAIDADFETGDKFVATVNGVEIEVNYQTAHLNTATAVAAAIADAPGIATCVLSGSNRIFTITAENDWQIAIDGLDIEGAGAPEPVLTTSVGGRTVATDVDELASLSRNWYGLASLTRTQGHLIELARGGQATDRMVFGVTADADVLDDNNTLDILSRTKGLNYTRFAGTYHDKSAEHIDAAVFARFLARNPGRIIFANKSLNGISLPLSLTTDQQASIRDKNGNYYKDVSGRSWYWPGKVASGDYIDTIRNLDYLYLNMRDDVLDLLGRVDIVPYDQEGADQLVNEIRLSLLARKDEGIITPNYNVQRVNVSKLSTNNKQNRLLPDVKWDATLKGAFQTIHIEGTVAI